MGLLSILLGNATGDMSSNESVKVPTYLPYLSNKNDLPTARAAVTLGT